MKGDAFVDGWHYFRYSRRVHEAPSALGYLRLVQQLGIRNFIAPRPDSGIPLFYPFIQSFLAAYTEPVYSYGAYSITRLKESLPVPSDAEVAASLPAPHACAADPAHAIDDLDAGIRYSGRWAHEIIFSAPFRGSISYSEASGADFQFTFTGSQVTWVYTQAPNRGQADVEMDGAALGTVDLYAPAIHWQSSSTFQTSPGTHTLRVRVRGEKSAAASGSYVDVDCLVGR